MNVWTKDFDAYQANIECGDIPDTMPLWAGPHAVKKPIIADFQTSEQHTLGDAHATFYGFRNIQQMISESSQHIFVDDVSIRANNCYRDRTVLIGVPQAHLDWEHDRLQQVPTVLINRDDDNDVDVQHRVYMAPATALSAVFYRTGFYNNMPYFKGCFNPTGPLPPSDSTTLPCNDEDASRFYMDKTGTWVIDFAESDSPL
jgi:hypothetical protein